MEIHSCARVEYIIKLLGLQRCADTVVGNQLLRGVSGGEKKRVTTAEILVGNAVVLLMDEISTGGVFFEKISAFVLRGAKNE